MFQTISYIQRYFQLLVLITTQYNINVLLRVLSITFPNIFATIKYCLFVVQANSVSLTR